MKKTLTLAAAAALLAVAAPALGDHEEPLTIDLTLRVAPEGLVVANHWYAENDAQWLVDPAEDDRFNDLDGVAGCDLVVADADHDDRVSGAEALDSAVASGCVSEWTAEAWDFGRFVTSVDGLEQHGWPASFWAIHVDGATSSVGVDDLALQDGESLELILTYGP